MQEKIKDSAKLVKRFVIDKSQEVRSDNNTVILLICLFVSTLFWFLKALNDEYRTEIAFPIEFSDIPDSYTLYGELPDELIATVEDDGFTIMRYKFSFVFSSFKFDVSNHFKKNDTQHHDGEVIISQAALKKSVESELIGKTNLISIYPETVSITYSKLQEKMLPIRVMGDITTAQQYIVNGKIRTMPDSISVIGSGLQLATVEAVYTDPVRELDLQDSVLRNVSLQSIDGLKFKKRKVKLYIPVENFTEKIVEVPIVGYNFPDSLRIRTFPGVATVSCICGLSVYSDIYAADFSCYVDYATIKDASNGHVELQVRSDNELAQRVVLRTKSIDYLIEKKK